MKKNLLTIGELAQLAETSNRTILFYEEKNIFNPTGYLSNGYRYYAPEKLIEFQIIMLLRELDFSLGEIKILLQSQKNFKQLFYLKQNEIKQKITLLRKTLKQVETYYQTLELFNQLITPKIKKIKPYKIYYISKKGPYSKIITFINELKSCFINLTPDISFYIFDNKKGFHPQENEMKIAIQYNKDIEMTPKGTELVKIEQIANYTALYCVYDGSLNTISAHWKMLYEYFDKQKLVESPILNTIEIYHDLKKEKRTHRIELQIPLGK